jgi:imidazolonepropionase-like amidohydrolase
MYDLALVGGTVVTPQGATRADVAVKDGIIAFIGTRVDQAEVSGRVIDVTGKVVLPGVIDAHVPDLDRSRGHHRGLTPFRRARWCHHRDHPDQGTCRDGTVTCDRALHRGG